MATLLNHANTYYWYARYRKNSQPEFERAQLIAQQVINEITDSIKAYPEHAVEYQSLANQAKTLNSYCVEQGAVSQLNIASYAVLLPTATIASAVSLVTCNLDAELLLM